VLLRLLIYKAPAIAWMLLIFFLSSGPVNPSVNEMPDYLLHSGAYAVLYVALFWAVHEGLALMRGRGGYILPGVITVLYGLSDEFHQSFIPSRDANVHDLLADVCGAIIGAAIVAALMRLSWQFRANRQV